MAPKKAKDIDLFLAWLKEHTDKIIDRVDPMETIAILGMTVIIKTGIDWTEATISEKMRRFPPRLWTSILGEPQLKAPFEVTSDWLEWIISFSIAFYVMRHGAEIKGSIVDFAKTLL